MLPVERRKQILSTLKTDKRVYVGALSRAFSVSEETIRRDLERLEAEGIVSRAYGGAVLNEDEHQETPYDVRRRSDVSLKTAIAKITASLIHDGEYIILDESSTSFFVAKELKEKKNLTVITNSMEIIREIASVQGWNVLCTGGALRSSAPSFA